LISFLKFRSRRHRYCGWALFWEGEVLEWSVCTTRAEVRQLRKSRGDLFLAEAEVVKVKIRLEVVR
jgi:hypothetical protein